MLLNNHSVWLEGGSAVVDEAGTIGTMDEALAAWLGARSEELKDQSLPTLLGQRHPEWETSLRHFLEASAPFDQLELTGQSEAGLQKLKVEICRHEKSLFLRFESELPPVTQIEDTLSESAWGQAAKDKIYHRLLRTETQLENLFNRWPGIIFSQRPDFSFASVSPKIEELTGVPASNWLRQSRLFWQVIHEADADMLLKRLKQKLDPVAGMTVTYRIRHIHTGRVTYLWEHRQAVYSSNGLLLGYEGIWLDITRQTIAERRLLTMSWKENLGTLTMGLAHDFCNIMTGIVSLSETFESELGENEPLRSGMTLIRSTAGQASELAHRIRQLHQGTPGQKNYHDLNEIVANMNLVLQKVLSRRTRVQSVQAEGQLPVYLDAVELQQVIVNLAMNAADAMPNGGNLTFRTSRHETAPKNVRNMIGSMPRVPLLCLSVQDTGTGIPPHMLSSIFDPFFTTKPLGKGSGLGLYNARLFAENHGTAIIVETQEQSGTTFHIWFAQADFSETEGAEPANETARQTVLVTGMADETRNRVVELLRANDFYVVPALPGSGALEALQSPNYNFSGVILLCHRAGADELSLCKRIHDERLRVRTFLSPLGRNHDEIETSLLDSVDATLPQELSGHEFIARLRTLLAQPRDSLTP